MSTGAIAQTDTLSHLSCSASLTFVQRDGTCLIGPISKADATTITVQPYKKSPVILRREDLFQVSQDDAIIYSGRSSWADVTSAHVYPREAFVLTLSNGKVIKGKSVKVDADTIRLKYGIKSTLSLKSDIKTVDHLRLKPESDDFDFMLQEAPYMTLFYPEFYYRAIGLEGRIPVRLYDASKPQDADVSAIKRCPYGAPSPTGMPQY